MRDGAGAKRRTARGTRSSASQSPLSALLDEVFPTPDSPARAPIRTGPRDPDAQTRLANEKHLDSEIRWLERKAALGERTAEISHEIRNALVAFKTFLRLLPEHMEDPEFVGSYRESVAEELARLQRLLDAVLHHAHPGAEDPVAGEGSETSPALHAVAQLLGHTALLRGVTLDCAPDAGPVALSRDALQQVLLNLTLNALEATPSGGRVRLSSTSVPGPGAGWVEILLDDDGVGIATEDHERIFAAFQSARGDRPGGLGLAICRGLVEASGGEIRLSSSTSGGARLVVRLPAR
ncbi:MAG: HAMP domain-containing sensor histidine kinase [Myxococcota bacterium]